MDGWLSDVKRDWRPKREMRLGDLSEALVADEERTAAAFVGARWTFCAPRFAALGDVEVSAVLKKPAGGEGRPPSLKIRSQVSSTLPER